MNGIDALVPRERQTPGARKLRDFYDGVPGAPVVQMEFGYYSMDRWIREGHVAADTDLAARFGFDPPGEYSLEQLGWCEAPFVPAFETKVLEDRGEHELVQDFAGRHVLFFKGRRSGFGLFNVRERLGYLGGSCAIDSAPGRGTRVELRLPLTRAQD